MIKRSMVREYLKYIVPTMLTFTLAGVYGIVDGIFVGHAVGDAGLAGINVAFPVVAFIMAVGTGVGMGGGVISSIARGAGDESKSRRAVGTTFLMLVLASVPIMALLFAFSGPLCELLGGRGETLNQAIAYINVIAWGVPFQILVTGCTPLIRNQGKVAFAMVVQVLAGLMNVALDYVFVIALGMGTAGAAEATVLSQVAAFVLVAGFFLRKENRISRADLRIDGRIAAHALKLGLAPFGLTLLPEATVVAINVNLATYGGETALAAYAVVSYTACVIQMLIQGVGDGSQPLISRYYGSGDADAVRRFRNTNYLITISLGVIGLAAMRCRCCSAPRPKPRGSSPGRCPCSRRRTCSTDSRMRPRPTSMRWTMPKHRTLSCTVKPPLSLPWCSAWRGRSGWTVSGSRSPSCR